jgi:hypothetical protein
MKRSILRKLILLLLALGLLVLGGVDYWYRNVREIPFDQQAWISTPAPSDNSDVRLRMYEDLKARYLVIGMQQSRVRDFWGMR